MVEIVSYSFEFKLAAFSYSLTFNVFLETVDVDDFNFKIAETVIEETFDCTSDYSFALVVLVDEVEYFCCGCEIPDDERMQSDLSNTEFFVDDSEALHGECFVVAVDGEEVLLVLEIGMNVGVTFTSGFKVIVITLDELEVFFNVF
jgi:hypothetical protein